MRESGGRQLIVESQLVRYQHFGLLLHWLLLLVVENKQPEFQ